MDGPNVKLGPFFKFMAYYKLSEILTLISGGTPKTTNSSYWGGNIPWLSVVDFNNDNRYVHTTEKTITEEGVENSSTKILPQGSLILSARGTVGALAQLAKPMAFNQSCYGIIAKEQTTNDFLYYLLKDVVEDLQAKGHGSVFNTITRDTFDTITVNLPSLDEQKRIAEILGSLDDKIELLQKQNKTLEDMAKALFKSWFVDFDVVRAKQKGLPKADIMREYHLTDDLYDLFPSSFADSPLGPIPSGWEVKPLSDIATLTMGQSPAGTTYNESGEGLPFYQGRTDFEFRFPKKRVYCSAPTRIAEKDDILISVRAPVGDLNMANEKCCIGRGVASIRSKTLNDSFLYYAMLNIQKQFDVFNTEGTVFGSINRKDLSSLAILAPSEDVLREFNAIITAFDLKIETNLKQIQTLTELRDTLLPRLISGKIRV